MHIPPYYRERRWQLFLAGMFMGGVISWFIFLYIFGIQQDVQVRKILEQTIEIRQLKERVSILLQEQKNANEQKQKELTIQDVKVTIQNAAEMKLNSLTAYQLTENLEKDLQTLLSKELYTIAQNKELIIKIIENKTYERDDQSYRFQVRTVFINPTVEIDVLVLKSQANQ